MKKHIKTFCIAAGLGLSTGAQADVGSDLNDFFSKMGGGANVTQGGAWKAQSAGYLIGGSLYARTPVRNIQLISITLPDVKAGCGGIDAYLGAFSYINSDQLKAMAKQILSNAVGYAFDLALETTMPTIKSVKDFLQKLATEVNSLNVSTCQAAQGIVGGLFPKSQAASDYICSTIGNQNNFFADFAAARHGCGTGGKTDDTFNRATAQQKQIIPRNKNLTWDVFTKINKFVSDDRELKELMMSMVGTIIYDKDGNITIMPGLGATDSLVNTVLFGGQTEFYRCNETQQCLQPTISKFTIPQNKSLVEQTNNTLYSILAKIKSDTVLNDKEKNLISTTQSSVYSYIRVVAELKLDSSFVTNLSEYIALGYTLAYIDDLISTVERASAGSTNTSDENEKFQQSLMMVRTKLGQRLSMIKLKQDALLQADNQLQGLRRQLGSETTSQFLQNYNFGN
ncbi:conjugal transfer protein TraH [Testudinibacter sp. TR-2022]|uniref:conjugal transfer protein TraH n=1 Tax=Testudinibacter sp. TR-2022 TaxID=2585029 RepID=UPI00111B7EF7|nr:conjugal transfer protein TraH [Testudinibacter sp. TR-2022]TNH04049.1 conjugal transfer protein TraH [Pasteurellaceae bacterium Phil31]TNH10166.1 conjugal transfer protein TraH [Testudinibacter sp. TR-2022]TNH13026.1 conjugal transfer protein TraH [Testudinibacter sp. TR-2022]